jgi:2-phosphoglycerate kinase
MTADPQKLTPVLFNHDVYWIGGSPCSGKSSLAGQLALRHGFSLFKSDDNMFEHLHSADPLKQPVMTGLSKMSWNEMWMRPVADQVASEFAFYQEEFAMLLDEISQLPKDRPVLAEGCAWLPELLLPMQLPPHRVVYIIPTKAFQVSHYSKRGFIKEILAQCEDPQTAFDNWMERDALFGSIVSERAQSAGFPVIRVDGKSTVEENLALVEKVFNLDKY